MTFKHIFLYFILTVSLNVLAQENSKDDYIVKINGDSIFAEKIRYFRINGKPAVFTLIKANGSKEKISIENVAFYQRTRRNRTRFYQIAHIKREKPSSYQPMQILESGKLTLLYEEDSGVPSFFVTGKDFHGYVTFIQNIKKLRKVLEQCPAFNEHFKTKKQKRFRHLEKMIRFYNKNCSI